MPRPLNATAASPLGFLDEGPMTGWDLVATPQERIGDFCSLPRARFIEDWQRWPARAWLKPEKGE